VVSEQCCNLLQLLVAEVEQPEVPPGLVERNEGEEPGAERRQVEEVGQRLSCFARLQRQLAEQSRPLVLRCDVGRLSSVLCGGEPFPLGASLGPRKR
jgi:hypothetical protein